MCLTTLYLHQDGLNALNSFHLSFYLIFQRFPKSGDPHKINMFNEKYLVHSNIKKCLKKKNNNPAFSLLLFPWVTGSIGQEQIRDSIEKKNPSVLLVDLP